MTELFTKLFFTVNFCVNRSASFCLQYASEKAKKNPCGFCSSLIQRVCDSATPSAMFRYSVPEVAATVSNPPSASEAQGGSSGISVESLLDIIKWQQAEHREDDAATGKGR